MWFLRLVEASEDPSVVFIGQDISKFFDSIHAVHLLQVLRFLRAPQQFTDFVQGVLSKQRRLFSMGSRVGARWHSATRGLAQGDPLSPLLAAAVMSVWTGTVALSTCEAVTFVDDRSFWGRSVGALTQAKDLSDRVDRAFQFRCDVTKCQVASAQGGIGSQVAALFGYEHGSEFETLGVRFYLCPGCVPMLARYSFEVADVRLQCINVVAAGLARQAAFIRCLVLPLMSWAGAMASIEREQLLQLRRAVVASVNCKNACDTPALLLWEILGWDCDPVFARRWAALRAAVATACEPPVWLEEAFRFSLPVGGGQHFFRLRQRCWASWAGGPPRRETSLLGVMNAAGFARSTSALTTRRCSSSGWWIGIAGHRCRRRLGLSGSSTVRPQLVTWLRVCFFLECQPMPWL